LSSAHIFAVNIRVYSMRRQYK